MKAVFWTALGLGVAGLFANPTLRIHRYDDRRAVVSVLFFGVRVWQGVVYRNKPTRFVNSVNYAIEGFETMKMAEAMADVLAEEWGPDDWAQADWEVE